MPIFELPDIGVDFPSPIHAEPDGLLAVGGNLSPERLINAYANGIFPWYDENNPILWWSPDPRFVLFPDQLHIPKSLRRVINARRFDISIDTAFEAVIEACATTPRPEQDGTWIVDDMVEAYIRLHDMGLAHSVEAWRDGKLVGGVYGVALGKAFFGESMFFRESDASKVCTVWLIRLLAAGGFELVDCQQTTENLARFGAEEMDREEFLERLQKALQQPTVQGLWSMPDDFFPL